MDQSPNRDPRKPVQPAPEPRDEDQVDIAFDVQRGLEKANNKSESDRQTPPDGHKATEFDGSPNPRADEGARVFKPADDTPAVMPTRQGPKNPE